MPPLTKTLIGALFAIVSFWQIVHAQCPVDALTVKGRVENATPDSKVRVQLVYDKRRPGESAEATVEDGAFQVPLEFVTQQSSMFTNLPKRCGRKPKTVVVTLLEKDHQADQVFLDFTKSFKMTDASAYGLRSEVVLNGRP